MKPHTNETPAEESIWRRLAAPFALKDVHLRVLAKNKDGSRGLIVAYVDARAVMNRLDEVVGPEAWSDTYEVLADGVVKCRLTVAGVAKEDVGVADEPKAAFSDALKRCAVKAGCARYLYDLDQMWGPLDQRGNLANPEEAKRRLLGDKHRVQRNGVDRGRTQANTGSPVPIPRDLPF